VHQANNMIKWPLYTIYFNRNCNFYIWYTALQDAKSSSPLHLAHTHSWTPS
jgi:hypothetical protein